MKKLLFVLALCLAVSASANDQQILYVDTIVAADTVAEAINVDTMWTAWQTTHGTSRYQFFYHILPYVTHLNATADTFYVYWQHTFDRASIRNVLLGKAADTISTWSTMNMAAGDSVAGNWGRFMVIHRDSTEADSPDSVDNIRGAEINLWISKIY